jgi:hypothetical protein
MKLGDKITKVDFEVPFKVFKGFGKDGLIVVDSSNEISVIKVNYNEKSNAISVSEIATTKCPRLE